MEPEKKGEIVEAKEQKPEKREEIRVSSTNKPALAIAIFALLFGGAGLALGWIAYEKSNTPITFLGSGTDGNSANFVEGSIADIADKVSKSVVSITTSTKATDFFGQSYDSSAAGTGIIVTSDGYVLTISTSSMAPAKLL